MINATFVKNPEDRPMDMYSFCEKQIMKKDQSAISSAFIVQTFSGEPAQTKTDMRHNHTHKTLLQTIEKL